MRKLLSLVAIVALFGGVVFPLMYFYYAQDLPDLSTAQAVQRALAGRVEAERAASTDKATQSRLREFQILTRSQLPNGLIAGLLAAEACPEYFDIPKEPPLERLKRLVARLTDSRGGPPGPGRCQLRFADLIAETIGAADPIHAAIADHRLLEALTLEELITLRLSSTYYTQGVIGARDASQVLFHREPAELDLAQSAELIVAESYYPDLARCKNPPRLRRIRDDVLNRMEAFGTITAVEAKKAQAKPLHCTRLP